MLPAYTNTEVSVNTETLITDEHPSTSDRSCWQVGFLKKPSLAVYHF